MNDGPTKPAADDAESPYFPPVNPWWQGATESFLAERERWVLWLPVLIGIGIGVYFSLPAEPPGWLAPIAPAIAIGATVAARRNSAFLIFALSATCVAVGFSVSIWRTATVEAPLLERRIGPALVSGRVEAVEPRPKGVRVTVGDVSVTRLEATKTPRRVRMTMKGRQPDIRPGMRMEVIAILAPPPPPSAPGAFDFQRQSYFRGLGAVGFSVGTVKLLSDSTAPWPGRHFLQGLRQSIGERVMGAVGGTTGAVAVALMVGERGGIPPDVMQAIRDAGLAHLLAISGLHIGLVAAILFGGLRGTLALMPPLALRYPIKKWAAAAAIAGALAYALIAGATVPTQRAFLMIGVVLLAVLLDRRGISMRMVAWAAVIILLLSPESLLGASFQMSFAAVTALIAAYEFLRDHGSAVGSRRGNWQRLMLLYIGGVALTTIIAASVTAPFVVYHFNRLAAYGLAANLVAVPVTALWVMPWAVIAFALMTVGLESLALQPMGWGIDAIVAVAQTISSWPGAVTVIPSLPTWGVGVFALGGLWACLWTRRWRLGGLAAALIGIASIAFVQSPDILVDEKGRLLAVRTADGGLALSSSRRGRFDRETWLRRSGLDKAKPWPQHGASADGRLTCDDLGCIYRANGLVAALVQRPEALMEDCAVADIVISVVPVRQHCRSAGVVIDRFDLWRNGGHAIWMEEHEIRFESVNAARGDRPWVVRPDSKKN